MKLTRPLVGILYSTQRASRAPNAGEVVLDLADGLNWESLCKCDLIYSIDRDLLHTRRGLVTTERRPEIVRVIVGCHGWNSIGQSRVPIRCKYAVRPSP